MHTKINKNKNEYINKCIDLKQNKSIKNSNNKNTKNKNNHDRHHQNQWHHHQQHLVLFWENYTKYAWLILKLLAFSCEMRNISPAPSQSAVVMIGVCLALSQPYAQGSHGPPWSSWFIMCQALFLAPSPVRSHLAPRHINLDPGRTDVYLWHFSISLNITPKGRQGFQVKVRIIHSQSHANSPTLAKIKNKRNCSSYVDVFAWLQPGTNKLGSLLLACYNNTNCTHIYIYTYPQTCVHKHDT